MSRPDPATTALLDQCEAGLSEHLGILVEVYRRLAMDRGGVQAGADITAMLARWPHIDVCALLSVAVGKLATGGEQR